MGVYDLVRAPLGPGESFTIGESSAAEQVDFELAAQELGALSARLVEVQNGTPHVIVPHAAKASVKRASEPYLLPSQATNVALLSGTVVELELGRLKFRIANVPAAKPRRALVWRVLIGRYSRRSGSASRRRPR